MRCFSLFAQPEEVVRHRYFSTKLVHLNSQFTVFRLCVTSHLFTRLGSSEFHRLDPEFSPFFIIFSVRFEIPLLRSLTFQFFRYFSFSCRELCRLLPSPPDANCVPYCCVLKLLHHVRKSCRIQLILADGG